MTKGWARRWKANNWMRNKNEIAQNRDLWNDFINLCDKHIVKFIWVRGHMGNIENERCDILAVNASMGSQLLTDSNFESQNDNPSLYNSSE
jgi:ribonuclease HI